MLVCAVAVIAVLASFPPRAFSATATQTLEGYAGSSNVGWICFYDLATPSNCGSASVQVNSDNSLSGYAWSNEAGWISFNSSDTASCGSAAAYNPSTGALSGWAKGLDGVDSDGCISLSGTAQDSSPYGVTITGGDASGYAWGSDTFGWISFWGSNYGVTLTPIDACTDILGITTPPIPSGCQTPSPSPGACIRNGDTYNGSTCVPSTPSISAGSFTTNPTRVQKNTPTSVTFSYAVTNPPAGGCTITGTGGFSTLSLSQAQVMSGSYMTSETISQNTGLTLTCGSATATATLGLVPSYQEI